MGWSLWLSSLVWLLLNSLLFNALVFANSFNTSSVQSLSCHDDDERSALLQFKQSFVIDRSVSVYEGAYPKILSWKSEGESSNCCSWDGVECDEKTGHVIGLVLNSSCLYGSIDSNSSLFRLVHLQKLNLADNHFNYSLIPSALGQFSVLTYLDLSCSKFYGQIPSEISHLSKLTFLDLSSNFEDADPTKQYRLLELKNPNLRSLIQNLPCLESLHLTSVYIPSTVPDFLANFTSLKSLVFQNCGLYGEFPMKIFHLPNLQVLNLGWNDNLTGYLPQFHQRSPLEQLVLSETSFSGRIPSSIEKLESLQILYLLGCKFSGPLPSSLSKLTRLTNLGLIGNHLGGPIPSWLGNLSRLSVLWLDDNSLSGSIPSSFQNLSQLSYLSLRDNHITGPIPTWIGNLTQLTELYLYGNELYGSIPYSLSQLKNLQRVVLNENNLSGTVEFDMFFTMTSLFDLHLTGNKLSLLFSQRNINATTSKFVGLGLGSCNLSEFPNFLKYQNKVEWLDLSSNKLHGHIPKWMWNNSIETLKFLFLDRNFLLDFPQPAPIFLPWVNLWRLDLRFNSFHGQLPIAPTSLQTYSISNNWLTGEISPLMCNLKSLYLLDLSSNNLSGMIPRCLGDLNLLSVLNLENNSFDGAIPQVCTSPSNLKMMDLSNNKFKGKVPRSLAACTMLEYLNVGDNQLIDVFPIWLGTLPKLKLLNLRHNGFYGVIKKPKQRFLFPKLCVIDLSYNSFTGKLPFHYILIWSALKAINITESRYMKAEQVTNGTGIYRSWSVHYRYSTTIVNKGLERYYAVIQENFAEIDFSSNKFNGEIPQFIGNLKALRSLNLSFNNLMGCIPSSMGNLMELESLDLSHNNLSGEIPQQLTGLTFLQNFDVSHNNLTGLIPQGNQFGTFENTSFEGNPYLCGIPLSKKCSGSKALPAVEEEDDSGSLIELDWKFILAGGISGFVVGVALGDMVIPKRHEWFLKAFRRIPPRMEIRQRRN